MVSCKRLAIYSADATHERFEDMHKAERPHKAWLNSTFSHFFLGLVGLHSHCTHIQFVLLLIQRLAGMTNSRRVFRERRRKMGGSWMTIFLGQC